MARSERLYGRGLDNGTICNGQSPELRGPTKTAGVGAARQFCLSLNGQGAGMRQSNLARTEARLTDQSCGGGGRSVTSPPKTKPGRWSMPTLCTATCSFLVVLPKDGTLPGAIRQACPWHGVDRCQSCKTQSRTENEAKEKANMNKATQKSEILGGSCSHKNMNQFGLI